RRGGHRREGRLPRRPGVARRARPRRPVSRAGRRRPRDRTLGPERGSRRLMHLTSSPVDWYAARAAGVAAYLLLSAVVALGTTMARRKSLPRWPRFALEDVHRFGGLLVGTFVAIHVVAIAIDSWLPFSIVQIVVPFTARYRPVWVGLGIVAAELL